VELRQLGKTGIEVSLLGLGTVKIGRNTDVKYPRAFTLPSDAQLHRLLDSAMDVGINLIDTAPAYGTSEERLGVLLKGRRERWIVATKVGEEYDEGGSRYDFSPEHARASVERSLLRLATDYLDVVLIHSDGSDLDILERHGTLDALLELKQHGVVRAVGVSHKTVDGARLALKKGADVIMATLNAADTSELGVIREAGLAGCGVFIKKALVSGHGTATDLPRIAAEPAVSSIVVGTISPAHLTANAEVLASSQPAA
jgi:aryl-alcohol dehydrogenase-like predicted oxidoreductase|tara:strand:+ start:194 stop:964 length:771 start_codon:yes stop_codon:yes gene_type:complete